MKRCVSEWRIDRGFDGCSRIGANPSDPSNPWSIPKSILDQLQHGLRKATFVFNRVHQCVGCNRVNTERLDTGLVRFIDFIENEDVEKVPVHRGNSERRYFVTQIVKHIRGRSLERSASN